MSKHNIIFILSLTLFMSSCMFFQEQNEEVAEVPVVQIYDNFLYPSDLKEIVGDNISPKDSAVRVQNFIDAWVRDRLLVHRAEQNLSDEEKNVKWQLEDYRLKLLIYRYEQKYIEQKLDTTITDTEIETYYAENSQNFVLNANVVNVVVAKIPLDAPKLNKAKWWMRSMRAEDSTLFADFATQYAVTFKAQPRWVYLTDLLTEVPLVVEDQKSFLQKNEFIEIKDNEYMYLIHIKKYRLVNEISPLYFVWNNVKTILLNEKKRDLIQKLEKNIFQDGIEQGVVKMNPKTTIN